MAQSLNKRSLKALNRTIRLFSRAVVWTKGSYKDDLRLRSRTIECYCLAGALKKAACGTPYNDNDVSKNLIRLAGEDRSVIGHLNRKGISYVAGSDSRVTSYNDAPRRTYTEIMALLGRMKFKLEAMVNAES